MNCTIDLMRTSSSIGVACNLDCVWKDDRDCNSPQSIAAKTKKSCRTSRYDPNFPLRSFGWTYHRGLSFNSEIR